jgi:hypothetical protein
MFNRLNKLLIMVAFGDDRSLRPVLGLATPPLAPSRRQALPPSDRLTFAMA